MNNNEDLRASFDISIERDAAGNCTTKVTFCDARDGSRMTLPSMHKDLIELANLYFTDAYGPAVYIDGRRKDEDQAAPEWVCGDKQHASLCWHLEDAIYTWLEVACAEMHPLGASLTAVRRERWHPPKLL
ncbi:hypothetical protein [Cupriavidus oxalaticus]|uniref:Uncharacterized protein n=1 Tax=Cupriavidus oxalaticus TaxID=96344 RepID=A0A5P3VLN6_9BURK|nr:hypothetical protein [Cupriavidus oxalaticus]QEZ45699.1 hypothetical protein D2917_15340 [Cupriavidus oxalaticus]